MNILTIALFLLYRWKESCWILSKSIFSWRGKILADAFVISKELVLKLLIDSIQEGDYNTLPELVAKKLPSLNVNAYEFTGYRNVSIPHGIFDFNEVGFGKKTFVEDVWSCVSGRNILTKVKDTSKLV